MNTLHKASLPALGLLAAFVLTGCSLLAPPQNQTPETPDTPDVPVVAIEDLNDTTWAGTDSGSTDTTFTFHEGGSTAVSFNGNEYDDPADTWKIEGSTLIITIFNVTLEDGVSGGDATYVGEMTDAAGPVDLDLTFSEATEARTLTITRS